jgi:hypothetical protein
MISRHCPLSHPCADHLAHVPTLQVLSRATTTLAELHILRPSKWDLPLLAYFQCPPLRSLHISGMPERSSSLIRVSAQLRRLDLSCNDLTGIGALLQQLNGLTDLRLHSNPIGYQHKLFSAAEQSELESALAALSNLQSLLLNHCPPGPVTQALSQLTGLTQLSLEQQDVVPNPGPLVLPSCVKLTICDRVSVQHLACVDAPQLEHLQVTLALKGSDLDTLRRLCRGVLRACTHLSLWLLPTTPGVPFEEAKVAVLTVLKEEWQPTAEALQPTQSSSGDHADRTISSMSQQCRLRIHRIHLTRQCLSCLPTGLTHLSLM